MRRIIYSTIIALLLSSSISIAAYRAPACSRDGMAATPHPAATEAAVAVLRAGGNAADAAAAAAFALSVVEPYHSGIGGGEFILVRMVKDGKVIALDARECASSAATPESYLDTVTGEPHPSKSWKGGMAAGTPGSVAGRTELVKRFGKLALTKVLAPSVKLAREGFPADRYLVSVVTNNQDRIAEVGASEVFLPKGRAPERGDLILQPNLALTLESIGKDQGDSFYSGKIADQISAACQASGGVMSSEDLEAYQVIERQPVHFTYRGLDVYSMPPPSSGGLCLAEILNILEIYPLAYLGAGSSEVLHLEASAFERAFADRREFLADPAFIPQPMGMASKDYAVKLSKDIDRRLRTPVAGAGDPWPYESANTSHLSVIDRDGNMCSITTSVNGAFGSFVYIKELGFFLNNTMDDFTISAKSVNQFGLNQGEVNEVAPGKRPLSSMSPTLVLKDGQPYLALGSVGGPRIITSVAQMLVNIIDFGMDVQAALDYPRIHMQYKPDTLYTETEMSEPIISDLNDRGWHVVRENHWSLSQAVQVDWNKKLFYGAGDSRGVGLASGPTLLP